MKKLVNLMNQIKIKQKKILKIGIFSTHKLSRNKEDLNKMLSHPINISNDVIKPLINQSYPEEISKVKLNNSINKDEEIQIKKPSKYLFIYAFLKIEYINIFSLLHSNSFISLLLPLVSFNFLSIKNIKYKYFMNH